MIGNCVFMDRFGKLVGKGKYIMSDKPSILNREEILKRISDKPWVSPFEKIVAVYSPAVSRMK